MTACSLRRAALQGLCILCASLLVLTGNLHGWDVPFFLGGVGLLTLFAPLTLGAVARSRMTLLLSCLAAVGSYYFITGLPVFLTYSAIALGTSLELVRFAPRVLAAQKTRRPSCT